MRWFILEGKGRRYRIQARSHNSARLAAAKKYKEETGSSYPASFWATFFESRVEIPLKPGRRNSRLPLIEEVVPV